VQYNESMMYFMECVVYSFLQYYDIDSVSAGTVAICTVKC